MAVRSPAIVLDDLRPEHWPAVARIYAEGIATGDATFETEVPSWERWDGAHLAGHRFVALRGSAVVGRSRSARSRTAASTAVWLRTACTCT